MSKQYPYRFKTESEFIKEFGEDWMIDDGGDVDWVSNMNYLFGKDYPFNIKEKELEFLFDVYNDGNWSVEPNMLIKNEKVPNYKPRKIIRE